jgi:hypothetical protein
MSDRQSKGASWQSKPERKEWWEVLDIILRQRMENEMQRNRERETENRSGKFTVESIKNIDILQEVYKQIQKENENLGEE